MKKIVFLAALLCVLATGNMNAQFIVHNNGNAEIGVDNFDPETANLPPQFYHWLDTVTVLRIFGRDGDYAAGGHLTFGDTYLYTNYNGEVRFRSGTGSAVFHHSIHIQQVTA